MKITSATIQNTRPYQEDRFFIHKFKDGTTLLGVFDGHGAEHTSDYLMHHVVAVFRKISKIRIRATPEEILLNVFEKLHSNTKNDWCGSTASIVWIHPKLNNIFVAILGDSPVILNLNGNIWKSPEHNVRTNYQEKTHAEERGGYVRNGYLFDSRIYQGPGLQMSRAFGDKDLDRVLNRNPEIFSLPLNEAKWILCCTDGLLDPGHNLSEPSQIISYLDTTIENGLDITADDLVRFGATLDAHDNSTAILIIP